jgi:hydrogen peroxide-dependent heme synthase
VGPYGAEAGETPIHGRTVARYLGSFNCAGDLDRVRVMSGAPLTLEGWYALHDIWTIDWPRWTALPVAERDVIGSEAAAWLSQHEHTDDGRSAVFSVLTQKGDLCLMHWRRTIDQLRRAETQFAQLRLRSYLQPSYSYLSVIELGTYELRAHAAAMLARQGVAAEASDFEPRLKAEMEKMARPRLFPDVPAHRYVCFYPMSKRRGEQVNWYDLSGEERAGFMRSHGAIGRTYAGQVVQVIAGSVGFDDWEWGVTLFADDPLVFKKLIYEMRFDPASSRYALFGPFYVGVRFAPADLSHVLLEGVPTR